MTTIRVTTQAELDAALARTDLTVCDEIVIASERGAWLEIYSSGSATVRAYGSATVSAYGSATVSAYGSATVSASGSATVSAYGSATVSAYGSATVSASGSATVRASGSATVRASDSATVSAYGSATVSASGSATVRASGSATVRASKHVAVHLHSSRVQVDGGVLIDVSHLDLTRTQDWLDHGGVETSEGKTVLYKAVDKDLNAGHLHVLTPYPVGATVSAPDWAATRDCGRGLHFGASPHHAEKYYNGQGKPRYLACEVDTSTLICLDDKAKAPSCLVLHEVDVHARKIESSVNA